MKGTALDRRTAITGSLTSVSMATLAANQAEAQTDKQGVQPLDAALSKRFSAPVFIATWPFAKAACETAYRTLTSGGSLLDAVERGINVTELDEKISSVGYGGLPNADGIVQLDASFMDGNGQRAGAVAAIEGYPNPISVARRVMETTKHVMLVGDDAAAFAKQNGFVAKDLLTPNARQAWQQWQAKQQAGVDASDKSHDTIALLGLGSDGHVVGGCSTSGLAFKLPGRVGDSPLIGSGLYVDGGVGAAGATGVGENVLRYCGSFLIVEFMRQGMTPTEACVAAIRRIASGDQRKPSELSVNFVALNIDGQVGAAGTDAGFRCVVVDADHQMILQPQQVTP